VIDHLITWKSDLYGTVIYLGYLGQSNTYRTSFIWIASSKVDKEGTAKHRHCCNCGQFHSQFSWNFRQCKWQYKSCLNWQKLWLHTVRTQPTQGTQPTCLLANKTYRIFSIWAGNPNWRILYNWHSCTN